MKNNTKTSEKEANEREISNLLDKELKVMVRKMLTGLERKIVKLIENFNKERKCKKEPELKNTVTKMKNILEGISS